MCADRWKEVKDAAEGVNRVLLQAHCVSDSLVGDINSWSSIGGSALYKCSTFLVCQGFALRTSARKCQVFANCCESINEEVNYLIDEADYVDKG